MNTAKIIDFAFHRKKHRGVKVKDVLERAGEIMDGLSKEDRAAISSLHIVWFEAQCRVGEGMIDNPEQTEKDIGGIEMYHAFVKLLTNMGKKIADI